LSPVNENSAVFADTSKPKLYGVVYTAKSNLAAFRLSSIVHTAESAVSLTLHSQ
jgi:hypothetical protein